MQVATGTVVNGTLIVEGISLQDGVVARGADESFRLSAADEDDLLAAMAQIKCAEFVSLGQLLVSLP